MTNIIGVRAGESGKVLYFDAQDLSLRSGDLVLVETSRGTELVCVTCLCDRLPEDEQSHILKPVVRQVTQADLERMAWLELRQEDALGRCAKKVKEHGLSMSLVKAEYNFEATRLTFYFTSDQRVDFRELVRDLARTFKSRIELRQISTRDEARLLGGIGPCGRMLCCSTFLPNYARVNIRMAKDQDMPLTPSKVTGLCGQLLCCLSYEHQQYSELKSELPAKGTWVQTPDGLGQVIAVNVLQHMLTVQLANSGMEEQYPVTDVQIALHTDTQRLSEVLAEEEPDDEQALDTLALIDAEDTADSLYTHANGHTLYTKQPPGPTSATRSSRSRGPTRATQKPTQQAAAGSESHSKRPASRRRGKRAAETDTSQSSAAPQPPADTPDEQRPTPPADSSSTRRRPRRRR